MATDRDTRTSNAFLRRMRNARLRLTFMATVSIAAAVLALAILSPEEVGAFAFYSVILLLLTNAVIALVQFQRVIHPVTTLLRRLQAISEKIDQSDDPTLEHLACETEDTFSCLAASFDDVLGKLSERLHQTEEELRQQRDLIQGIAITLIVVSRNGKILRLIKEQPGVVLPAGLEPGQLPSESVWGVENVRLFKEEVKMAFERDQVRWLTLRQALPGHPERIFRVSIKRANDFSAVMSMGDITVTEENAGHLTDPLRNSLSISRNTALRHMAASIAHDAKTFLSAIDHLVSKVSQEDSARLSEQVPTLQDALLRGNHLMEELADFAGDVHLELTCLPARENLLPLFDSAAIRTLVPENIQLFVSASDEEMPEIDLDPDRLKKVAVQLVRNSVEAMKGTNGRIWVTVKPCVMTDEIATGFRHTGTIRNGKGVLIEVTDDGPGIPESLRDRIFDPYITDKGEGRGLGLATVMTIVDAHGGAISVRTSKGYGTSFYLYLPASRNTEAELKLIREVAPNGEILLVDDDPTILHTTSLVLRTLKIAAHPAASEEDAITKLRSLRNRLSAVLVNGCIRCVISSGLVRKIHAEFPSLPVVLVSGAPEETIARQFADVPYDRFLSKPYSVEDLSQVLKGLPVRS